MDDFAFLVDMFNHLNELNTKLQGDKQLISDLYHHVGGFHGKLKVWEDLFEEAFVDEDTFPILSKKANIEEICERYMEKLSALREESERQFADFKSVKDELCAFSAPHLTEVLIRLQVEVVDLNTDLVYSPLFALGLDILSAYQPLPQTRYPRLKAFASRYISMFGSTYNGVKMAM